MYRINTVLRFNIVIKPKVTTTTFLRKYTDETVLRKTSYIYFRCVIYFKITNQLFYCVLIKNGTDLLPSQSQLKLAQKNG